MRFIARIAFVVALAAGIIVPAFGGARPEDPPTDEAVLANAPLDSQSVTIGSATYTTSPFECLVIKSVLPTESNWAGRRNMCGYINAFGGMARFNGPTGICLAPNGGTYVADTNNQVIRKIDAGRNVTMVVGTPGVVGTMTADVTPMTQAVFRYPQGVSGNGSKNFYVFDTENHCIWYVNRNNGNVYLVAGEPGVPGNVYGPGRTARLRQPRGIATHLNPEGTLLLFEDYGNGFNKILRLTPTPGGGMTGCVTIFGLPGCS